MEQIYGLRFHIPLINLLMAGLITDSKTDVKRHFIHFISENTTVVKYKTSADAKYLNGELLTDIAFPEGSPTRCCWEFSRDFKAKRRSYSKIAKNGKRLAYYTLNGKRNCCMLWRLGFIDHQQFDSKNFTVSHLCHNERCYNPSHHELEPLDVNKGRNGCAGGKICRHEKKCLMPGPNIGY